MLNQPIELIIILLIILLLFGPRKLPELARGLGEAVREFRRAAKGAIEDTDSTKEKSK